jgi:hypothetical protein
MEPQPLSGKAEIICFEDKRGACFYKEDIEAAVNWLKEKLENESRSNVEGSEAVRYPVDYYRVMRLIDEAFADVVPTLKA